MGMVERFLNDPMPGVPEHLQDGLRRYIVRGIPTGHFLMAVLENDLVASIRRGDPESKAGLVDLVRYLENHAPVGCYGDVKTVEAWIRAGGLVGRVGVAGTTTDG